MADNERMARVVESLVSRTQADEITWTTNYRGSQQGYEVTLGDTIARVTCERYSNPVLSLYHAVTDKHITTWIRDIKELFELVCAQVYRNDKQLRDAQLEDAMNDLLPEGEPE